MNNLQSWNSINIWAFIYIFLVVVIYLVSLEDFIILIFEICILKFQLMGFNVDLFLTILLGILWVLLTLKKYIILISLRRKNIINSGKNWHANIHKKFLGSFQVKINTFQALFFWGLNFSSLYNKMDGVPILFKKLPSYWGWKLESKI